MSDGNRRTWNRGFMRRREERHGIWKNMPDIFSGIGLDAIWIIHAKLIPSAAVNAGDEVCLSGEQDESVVHARTRVPLLRLTASAAAQVRAHIGNDVTIPVVGEVVAGPDEYGLVEIRLARAIQQK